MKGIEESEGANIDLLEGIIPGLCLYAPPYTTPPTIQYWAGHVETEYIILY